MKILFAGGGSLGPVTPLIAVIHVLREKQNDTEFVWVGTERGPEKDILEKEKIPFYVLPTAKVPRYPSIQWLMFPFAWMRAKRDAEKIIAKEKPDVVVSVGGFTAVPIVYAARRKKIPCVTHQLDVVPGLANKRIAPKCQSVTTSFEYSKAPFGDGVNDDWIATPVRFREEDLTTHAKAARSFGMDPSKPIIFITGGGTGAQGLNAFVSETVDSWRTDGVQLIHTTGEGKGDLPKKPIDGYFVKPRFDADEMLDAYAAADLVITRGGLGALSELSALKKAMIIVPIPSSHQEYNALAFEERGAALVVHQDRPSFFDDLYEDAYLILKDEEERTEMGERAARFLPTDDGSALAERIVHAALGQPDEPVAREQRPVKTRKTEPMKKQKPCHRCDEEKAKQVPASEPEEPTFKI